MTILAGVFPSSFIHPLSHVRHHIKHHHVSNITIKNFQEILPALHGSIKYWLSLRGSVYAKVWLRRSSMVKCELWDLLSLFSCRILRPSTRNAVVVRHNRITQNSLRFPMMFSIICREQFTTEKKLSCRLFTVNSFIGCLGELPLMIKKKCQQLCVSRSLHCSLDSTNFISLFFQSIAHNM